MSLWVANIERAPMDPRMLGRRYGQSQSLQAVFLGREIRQADLKGDVVNAGLEWLQAHVAGLRFAVEECRTCVWPSYPSASFRKAALSNRLISSRPMTSS